jgi:hypothetical protein
LREFVNEPFTPERGHDPNYSACSDVFSFGAIVLDFLSTVALEKWTDLRLALSQVQAPPDILEIIESTIAPDPALRPADGQILSAEIEAVQRTRQRLAGKRRPCFVTLTANAITGIKRNDYLSTDRDAQALVLREVNGGSYLRRYVRLNKDTGVREYPENEYFLSGPNMEFHVAVDRSSKAEIVVVSARRPASSGDLDNSREEGWPHPFEFRIGKHPVPSEGQHVLADLKMGCEQFEQQRSESELARAEEALFRGWSAVLQARTDQADSNQAVPYTDRTIEGNRITFRTKQPLDIGAVEQFWEVPLGEDHFIRGVIDSVEGDLATLYVEGTPSNKLPTSGVLRLDARSTKAALKRQKDALDTVKFGKAARAELKEFILHPESCQAVETVPPEKWWVADIDTDKQQAVKKALAAKDFFVVHGPPGTGKTTFITELLLQYLERNPHKRILLTSQTHIGVDNAIERLDKSGQSLHIIRVGTQTGKIAESVHPYLLQNKIRAWNEQVQRKAEQFIEALAAKEKVNLQELRLGLRLGQLIGTLRKREGDDADLAGLRAFMETHGLPPRRGHGDEDTMDAATADDARARAEEIQDQIETVQQRIALLRQEEKRLREELKQFGEDGKTLQNEKLPELVQYQEALLGKSEANQRFRRMLLENPTFREMKLVCVRCS